MARFLSGTLFCLFFILNAHADIYSASNALTRGDYATAVAEFTKLAEKGDASAQVNLGYMYYVGEGVPQDYKQAVNWYRKAAVQGNRDAQYNLAVSYAFGEGVKQDLTEAAIWYRRAGEQGHIVSLYSLAISYAYGEGVPQDQKEAARWFKKAAEQGYARAQVHLGSMYHTGEGVEQNYSEAVRWYRMAADRGDATAQYNLGTLYRSGKGVEQNYSQAKRWFRQSADQGYAAAQNELISLERSAAANVATRTIQAKPELIPSEETGQPAKQQTTETVSTTPPVETSEITKQSSEIEESAKKPLFSVEKKDLLALDDSELDIVEPEAPAEPETKEEVATQIEEPKKAVPAEVEVTEVKEPAPEPVASDKSWTRPIGGTPGSSDESESSGDLFSALGKLFSGSEEADAETALTETDEVEVEEPAPEPVDSDESWTRPIGGTPGSSEEDESSGGLFSALGDFFSGDKDKTETALDEPETQTETDDVLIAKVEEPAPVVEEIELAQEVEIDLSQYSVSAGRRALTNNDYDEAAEQFRPLAEAGDSEAQAHLGSLYYVGKGVKQDFKEAYNWYQKSADQGNMDAQYSIGNMYLLGEGVEQNNTNAAKSYALASEQGHIAAKNNLDNLRKLEALNHENQLKQEALANQDANEKSLADTIEDTDEIDSLSEETTDTASEPAIEEEKKPGLLALLGGLFGGGSEEESTQESHVESDVAEVVSETDLVEPDPQETNVNTYAAGEAPSTNTLQTLSNEEPIEDMQINDSSEIDSIAEKTTQANNITLLQDSQPSTSESPDFFKSLFGSDDTEIENETDNAKLESTEEIQSINVDSLETEEEFVIETKIEKSDSESSNAIAEVTEEEEQVASEESGGFFGFFGKLFSSDDENDIDNSESEPPQEVAMAEPAADQVSINDDEPIIENQPGEEISNSEIDRLRPLATQGDLDAQYKLGTLYYSGNGVKQDYSQAALWYRRAAQQGNVDAQYSLGNMYLMGEGIGQDDSQAANWYTLAADQGHDSAKHNLANLQKTLATEPQREIEATTISNDQLVSIDNENTAEPVASSDTTGKTEYEQGLAYAFGDGVPQNDRTAFNLFYQAAEKGYALAQYKVGVAFAYGEGVRLDQKKAAEWYRKAAEQGYTIAQRNLATMYLNGKGIEQNKIQALAWYNVVANSGNAMDIRRRDMLEKELTEIELSQSLELEKQISSRLSNNPSL